MNALRLLFWTATSEKDHARIDLWAKTHRDAPVIVNGSLDLLEQYSV